MALLDRKPSVYCMAVVLAEAAVGVVHPQAPYEWVAMAQLLLTFRIG